jgi:gliding motility-associated-like protein
MIFDLLFSFTVIELEYNKLSQSMSYKNILNSIIGFTALMVSSHIVNAQAYVTPPKPSVCTTLPAGYFEGGKLDFQPQVACYDGVNSLNLRIEVVRDPNIALTIDNAVLYPNIDNSFNITAATGTPFPASKILNVVPKVGINWYMVTGEKNGQKYLKCFTQKTLSTLAPKVTVQACPGQPAQVTIETSPESSYDSYRIDWGDSFFANVNATTTPLPASQTHTYTTTPTGPITVIGRYANGECAVNIKTFQAPAAGAQVPTLITTLEGTNSGAGALITFKNSIPQPGKVFKIEGKVDDGLGGGTWSELADGVNETATLTGLDPTKRYCFRTKVMNTCNTAEYSKNEICSINLKATLNSTTEADLRWNLPTTPAGIPLTLKLQKDQDGCTTCVSSPPLATKTTVNYTDKFINCTNKYKYFVTATYANVAIGTTSYPIKVISPQITVDPKSMATSIKPDYLFNVSYDIINDKDVKAIINIPSSSSSGANKYTFFRAENNSQNFIQLTTTNVNSYLDVSITDTEKAYCYKYKIEDQCGITSDFSDPACTILLTSQTKNFVNWTPYEIPASMFTSATPQSYDVELFDEDVNAFVVKGITGDLIYDIAKIIELSKFSEVKFRVRGVQYYDTKYGSNQQTYSYSNTITVKVPPGIFAPNAFTPNGDGNNETFKIYTKFLASGSYTIYDRWGGTIFNANALTDEWDGSEKNGVNKAPAGVYNYVIKATSDTGDAVKLAGSLLLLR